jgi:hypothetical protein
MESILRIQGWKNDRLSVIYEDSELRILEEIAGTFHTDIEYVNKHITIGYYRIRTEITGSEKENHYKLRLKARYYGDKSKHEHKKNTHRQKINI